MITEPRIFQAIVIRQGLKFYAKTKMLPNRAWKPMTMLKAAARITGKNYKRGDYLKAAEDLLAFLENTKLAGYEEYLRKEPAHGNS
jgi:hypothetical protein